jgi:hypothetical protein
MRSALATLLLTLSVVAQPAAKQRGMTFVSGMKQPTTYYGSDSSTRSLKQLKSLGVDWVAIVVRTYQSKPDDTTVKLPDDPGGESDANLRKVIDQAHALRFNVLFKVHVELDPPHWGGTIDHHSEEAWRRWFTSYRAAVMHYAALARSTGVESFCIGNELKRTTYREADWRLIIRDVRREYKGTLTYGANFDEVFTVHFWDALDVIGVSGYYPLLNADKPARAELAQAWKPVIKDLGALARQWDRKVLFTELGYRSADHAVWKQWEVKDDASANPKLQADAYGSFFDAVWPEPWVAGVYWWVWHSYLNHSTPTQTGFEIEHKPAAEVVKTNYLGKDPTK